MKQFSGLAVCLVVFAALPPPAVHARPLPSSRGADPAYEGVARPLPGAIRAATPWGEPAGGLACRLLMLPEYCRGEPVWAVVEVTNVTDRAIYFHNEFDIQFPMFCGLEVTAPDGRALKPSGSATHAFDHRNLRRIEPGACAGYEFADLSYRLRTYVQRDKEYVAMSQFDPPGVYRLVYRVHSVPVGPTAVTGERTVEPTTEDKEKTRRGEPVPPRVEKVREDAPGEVINNQWGASKKPVRLTMSSQPAAIRITEPTAANLTVHEWGVFTVFNGRALANADRKAEWESLPDEFYRQFPKGKQRLRWEPAAWDKPIVYFYSDKAAMNARIEVEFPEGAPVVWWPSVASPKDDGVYTGNRQPLFRSLRWDACLGRLIPVDGMQSSFQREMKSWFQVREFAFSNAPPWISAARLTNAMPVTVWGSHLRRSAPWMTSRKETEGFIYYDGLVPAPDYLRCVASDDASVTVKNTASFEIGELFLVDRRKPDNVLFTTAAGLKPGVETRVAFSRNANITLDPKKVLAKSLLAAGLYRAEVDSLLKIWSEGLFARPGLTTFYVLPRAEYDRMIKLTVSPAPPETVRVGIALHPNFEAEPALAARAQALIARLSAGGADADAAARELLDIGPTATRAVRDALAGTPSPELKARGQAILDQVDASDYMK